MKFLKYLKRQLVKLIPDKLYLMRFYKKMYGETLDLRNPDTFDGKLQWLKLYDRNPLYTTLADKYAVKEYVSSTIGSEHIIKTLGMWKKFEDIDFNTLPKQFVLKCNHDSGGMVICKDKTFLDLKETECRIKRCLKNNFYWQSREWPYKNIQKCILAEEYMVDDYCDKGLIDYKFYCFNGIPKFLYVSQGLENHATASISFLTMDWSFAPYKRSDFKPLSELPQKPETFEEMKVIAQKLAQDIPFVRVDLYQINKKVYFSELTFSPCGGFCPFENMEQEREIGKLLLLPNRGIK